MGDSLVEFCSDWPLPPSFSQPFLSYHQLPLRVERFTFGIWVLSTVGWRGAFLWGMWLERFACFLCSSSGYFRARMQTGLKQNILVSVTGKQRVFLANMTKADHCSEMEVRGGCGDGGWAGGCHQSQLVPRVLRCLALGSWCIQYPRILC